MTRRRLIFPSMVICGLLLLVGCERAKDRTAEEVIEKAIAKGGRRAKVTLDRQQGSITIDLGDKPVPGGSERPADVPMPTNGRPGVEPAPAAEVELR